MVGMPPWYASLGVQEGGLMLLMLLPARV